MADAQKEEILRADCSKCGGERNCDVVGKYDEKGEDGDGDYMWHTGWYLLKCRGCDHVFAQTVSTNSEDYDNYYDQNGETVTEYRKTIRTWPAQAKRVRPDWFAGGSIEATDTFALDDVLEEVYSALESDLRRMAAIGIRTAFDVAAELLKVSADLSFAKKLDALVEQKHIGPLDRERLEYLVESGNASAHRGWRPSADELATLMGVLEQFVHDAFVAPYQRRKLDEKAAALRSNVPKRLAQPKRGDSRDNGKALPAAILPDSKPGTPPSATKSRKS